MRRLDLGARARRITVRLSPFASLAGTILALYGAVQLANPIIGFFFEQVTPARIDGAARPICEEFPFYSADMANSKHYKLMGAHIRTFSTVSRLRLVMDNIQEIQTWGMLSSSLSVVEQNKFTAQLPRGRVVPPVVTPELPTLERDTDSFLMAIVVPVKDRCIDGLWLSTRMPEGKVYVTDPSEQVYRDLNFVYDLGHGWKAGLVILALGAVMIAIKYRRLMAKSKANAPES